MGATWTSFRPPSPKAIGAIQHFAASVIFYAATGELLPDVIHHGAVWPVVFGDAIGIATMLLVRRFTEDAEGPLWLIAAFASMR